MISIRPAATADVPAVARVHVAAWQESYAGLLTAGALTRRSVADREATWSRVIASGEPVFVAEDTLGLSGFVNAGPRPPNSPLSQDGEIRALYLLRRAQRQGAGRRLMAVAARSLLTQGCRQAALWVFDDNTRAIRFYAALGGQPVAHQSLTIADWTGSETAYAWDDVTTLFRP